MQVGKFLFFNAYIPNAVRNIVDKYYSANQSAEYTTYQSNPKDQYMPRRDILLNYLINDDIQLSANSSFITLNDFFNLSDIGNIIDSAVTTEAAVNGVKSQVHANYQNLFNYSLWEKTEPMTISLKIVLYSKTDPLIDVMIPAYMIMGHAGVDKIPGLDPSDGKYAVPGISFLMANYIYQRNKSQMNNTDVLDTPPSGYKLSNSKDPYIDVYTKSETSIVKGKSVTKVVGSVAVAKKSKPFNSKLFSFLIDGLVYLDKAYIKSISATFSKHTAKSSEPYFDGNYPIWAELDVQVESLIPAISSMLWDSLTSRGSTDILTKEKEYNL